MIVVAFVFTMINTVYKKNHFIPYNDCFSALFCSPRIIMIRHVGYVDAVTVIIRTIVIT